VRMAFGQEHHTVVTICPKGNIRDCLFFFGTLQPLAHETVQKM